MICRKILDLLRMDEVARAEKIEELSDEQRVELLLNAIATIEELDNEVGQD